MTVNVGFYVSEIVSLSFSERNLKFQNDKGQRAWPVLNGQQHCPAGFCGNAEKEGWEGGPMLGVRGG